MRVHTASCEKIDPIAPSKRHYPPRLHRQGQSTIGYTMEVALNGFTITFSDRFPAAGNY